MNRRGFLGGLISALAAPAIVRIDSIMPIRNIILIPPKNLLTMSMITKEAVKLFRNSNVFLQSLNSQYDSYYDDYEDEEDDYKVAA